MSRCTQKEKNGLYELTDEGRAHLSDSKYYNDDLAPTQIKDRTWNTYHIAALWVGMSVCIPSFTMASSLVVLGLSPWMAVLNVALGNLIVLIPIQFNSHAGTKYGIPFPVFARLTFGMKGAHIPSLSRALTACGWNAVQCWIGGGALVAAAAVFFPALKSSPAAPFVGFAIFLIIVWWFAANGANHIKALESIGAPILVILTLGLFFWSIKIAKDAGFSFSQILDAKTDYGLVQSNGGWWLVFLGGLTANIAFWATMALNIPDFSRFAASQKAQFRGQLYGMPLMMALTAFIGAFFAQATKLAIGEAMFDPTAVLTMVDSPIIALIAALGLIIATLTTDIAANVVAPANGFSNISPQKISYKRGVLITVIVSIAFRPWWIFGGAGAYIFGWLNTYGGILSPIAAIFIADYYVTKKKNIDAMALFQDGEDGRYWYNHGFNSKAIIAWIAGFILPTLGNLGVDSLKWVAANGYFVGFVIGFIVYALLMKGEPHKSFVSQAEMDSMTETL